MSLKKSSHKNNSELAIIVGNQAQQTARAAKKNNSTGLIAAPYAEPIWLGEGNVPVSKFQGHPEKSLFSGHDLQVKQIQPISQTIVEGYWISGIILLIIFLFAWLQTGYRKRVNQIFGATMSIRYLNQFLREEYTLGSLASILLSLIFVLVSALFIFQANDAYHFLFLKQKGIELYFIICISILIMYSIKLTITAFTGFILNKKTEFSDYILTIFMFNETLGLLLIPVVIAIAYITIIPTNIFYFFGAAIITVTLLYRTLRSLIIAINNQSISKSYLFLYLCALEILPTMVFIKLFIRR